MTLIQDKLNALIDRFKKSGGLDEKRLDNMKKTIEAAKQAAEEAKRKKA